MPSFALVCLVMLSFATASSGAAVAPAPEVAGVRPGARGFGLTVLRGSEPVRFEVEILGTLKNSFPKGDMYLARVSGAGLEKSGVIAGMSGSPIWIDGRLVGALAYSWQFASEPLAGITPIETMRRIPSGSSPGAPARFPGGQKALAALGAPDPVAGFREILSDALPAFAASDGWAAAETPLLFRGLDPSTLESFGGIFRRSGLVPIPSGGAGAGGSSTGVSPKRPVPGGSVAAILIDGDLSVSALGTVTEVDGDRVLAFGHPFLSLGPVELPLADAEVIGVLPSVARSSKFGAAGAEIGVVLEDRNPGIAASLSGRARTIPFEIELRGQGTFRFRLASQPLMLPLLAALVGDSTLASATKGAGETTLALELEVKTRAGSVRWADRFSGTMARQRAVASLGLITAWLAGNDVGGTDPLEFRLAVGQEDGLRRGKLVRADLGDRVVRAGQEIRLRAHLREARGDEQIRLLPIRIPADFPPGRATLVVGNGRAITALEFLMAPTDPRTPAEALALVSRIRPSNRLSALLLRRSAGAIVDGEAMPDLPSSVVALLPRRPASPADGGISFRPVAEYSEDLPFELDGTARLEIDVRPAAE